MLRSALLIGAGIVAALVVACAPPPPAPPPAAYVAAAYVAAACDLGAKAVWLAAPFIPASGNVPQPGSPVDADTAADLNAALAIAPPEFQNRLCELDGLFIDRITGCGSWGECLGGSWGLRHRNPVTGYGRYVILSAGLWNGRVGYGKFEEQILKSLSRVQGATFASNPEADTFAMTVLAALAHEMGHIRWYEIVVPRAADGTYNPDQTKLCGGVPFPSWLDPAHRGFQGLARWRNLLTFQQRQNDPVPDAHKTAPQTYEIDELGNTRAAGDLLDKIYRPDRVLASGQVIPGPWASFFASLSVDEDFVETYKFRVLMEAKQPLTKQAVLTSLAVTIPVTGGSHMQNVPDDYINDRKKELAWKVNNCIPATF